MKILYIILSDAALGGKFTDLWKYTNEFIIIRNDKRLNAVENI